MFSRARALRASILATALTAAAIGVAACGGSSSGGSSGGSDSATIANWGGVINTGGTPVSGGVLRVDQSAPPRAISPTVAECCITSDLQVIPQVFDQLIEFKTGSIDPAPGLAERWEISTDGLTYTFHLREAQFSDGTPVTAADAKFSLDRTRSQGRFAQLFSAIKTVDTPDDKTVVLHLSHPAPGIIDALALPLASVLPSRLFKSMGLDNFNAHPVGSGAFVVKSYQPGRLVVLQRNPKFWGRPAYLDEIRFTSTPNDNTRLLNIESGTSDVVDEVPFSQIASVGGRPDVDVLVAPSTAMTVIWFNEQRRELKDPKVRQALNYATDKQAIQRVVFFGRAPIMNTPMPKLKYWNRDTRNYPYDVDKARELLQQSSVPNGFKTTISITGTDQASNQIAQIIQQSWAKIGVDLTIRKLDHGTLLANNGTGNWDLNLFLPAEYSSDVPVDDQFASLQFDSPELHNLFSYYENPTAARLAREATSELDESVRAQKFHDLQDVAMQDPQLIPLVYAPRRIGVRSNVRDLDYMLVGWWRLESVWLQR
ncbi:MAG TPA: ABC transporter substrate-binding protein [Conexibacter sp.]|nr:ABC transporter substrate-binding protein [Conexibacter sp.]